VLHLRGAMIGYGSRPVLLSADLDVWPGESVAILGGNGAGKTTLVRALLGLAAVLAGEVHVAGRPAAGRRAAAVVGYVPQRLSPPTGVPTTAAEVVGAGLLARRRYWRPERRDRGAVRAALAEVGLAHLAGVPVTELSSGQHRRVLIARALVSEPEVLILDEPTAGVDRASVRSLLVTLTALRHAGLTLLVVTHELDEVESVVDRVVTLVDGTVVEETPTPRPVGGH
jgi:zinc transport system ATP-binding protein